MMDAGFSQQNSGGDARTQDLIRTVADISVSYTHLTLPTKA